MVQTPGRAGGCLQEGDEISYLTVNGKNKCQPRNLRERFFLIDCYNWGGSPMSRSEREPIKDVMSLASAYFHSKGIVAESEPSALLTVSGIILLMNFGLLRSI